MKRILVLSDSHGNVNNMVTAVGRLHPDMIMQNSCTGNFL